MRHDVIVREEPGKPLTAAEAARLKQLQETIIINFRSFVAVGQALSEIRDRKLYRETHPTFERYCKDVLDVAKSRAYQYMAAAEVVENVHNCGQKIEMLPLNEAQVRPLTRLRPEQQVAVWRAVVEHTGPGQKVTASMVNKVVKRYLGEKTTEAIRNRKAVIRHEEISAAFKEVFTAFLDQLIRERQANYKTTPRAVIIRHLDQLRAEIAEDGELIDDSFLSGSDDAMKLLRAGYRLFRMDKSSRTIREHSGSGWKKHSGPFETIKAMEAAFRVILHDEKHLRG